MDHAASTKLSDSTKQYLTSILDYYGNPSSLHSVGQPVQQLISDARQSVAKFINANPDDIYFTPSGSAGNTLAIKGLTSENPQNTQYAVFYSPTAHKSMLKTCESCLYHRSLKVNSMGEIDFAYLDDILTRHNRLKPLVCVEAANSEIGTINDVIGIASIVHKHNGILVLDATAYIPSYPLDMKSWKTHIDILTFSGHKLHALKGIGILWKRKDIELKPLIYGNQQDGIIAGTENVLGIASLAKAVQDYDYSSITPDHRNYVYNYIINHIPDSYLVGASIDSGNRLPNNLYMCFKDVDGDSFMLLLDMNGIQVSTGSACNSGNPSVSTLLSAIRMEEADTHSCIRMSFSGTETKEELDYVCNALKECARQLRSLT